MIRRWLACRRYRRNPYAPIIVTGPAEAVRAVRVVRNG